MEQIIESYYNGQYQQLVRQIDEYGLKDFVLDLQTNDHGLTHFGRYLVIRCYFANKTD